MGADLPATVVFDYPSVGALVGYIHAQLLAVHGVSAVEDAAGAPSAAVPAGSALAFVDAIGVLAVAGRDALAGCGRHGEAQDTSVSVPHSRWDRDGHSVVLGETSPGFSAFVCSADLFDGSCFAVADAEAVLMDPQQRVLLEATAEVWSAAEGSPVMRAKAGAFVGIAGTDYSTLVRMHVGGTSAFMGTGSTLSVAAGRLSYTFAMSGPAVSVDTACSSSLVGTHVACNSVALQECPAAVVCGVNLLLTPFISGVFSRAGMLSVEGRCKTLDASADGYVRGEAVRVLLLGSAGEQLQLRAVVRGSAVNQDGRSSSLTAPNGPAQQDVVRSA